MTDLSIDNSNIEKKQDGFCTKCNLGGTAGACQYCGDTPNYNDRVNGKI